LKEFGREQQRTLPCLPQKPIVQSAASKRLIISWWDREVYVWRLAKPFKKLTQSEDSENELEVQNRKLVTKIILKGEANITSASISFDGSLLAISTVAEIKVFQLKERKNKDGGTMKVSKLAIPQSFSKGGARLVEFSPDSHWLCIIRNDSRVSMGRLVRDTHASAALLKFLPIVSKLERLARKIEKRKMLGGLGAYDRMISRVAFSSDSRILAVSDLAGYVDTWLLEGHEDLLQAIEEDGGFDDASDSSSEDDQSEDVEDKKSVVVLGQHWIRNPSASLIPKLPSSPVVLSFRPASAASQKEKTNGVIIPHATRHNPRPHSHNLPSGEDRLLVVTSSSNVLELEVLRGCLTAWSRSNPTSHFPQEFRGLRDQAMGCLWDVSNFKERVWLYGSSWLWMFDLSRNLPLHEAPFVNGVDKSEGDQVSRKRKRTNRRRRSSAAEDLRKGTSGAGSKIADADLGTGMSRKMQRVIYDEIDEVRQIQPNNAMSMDIDDDAFENDERIAEGREEGFEMSALERLRRGEDVALRNTAQNAEDGGVDEKNGTPHWWHAFKYRPIMGIVPIGLIGEVQAGESAEYGGLEVALVERPLWEVDLPPRYYGDQEWEKPGP